MWIDNFDEKYTILSSSYLIFHHHNCHYLFPYLIMLIWSSCLLCHIFMMKMWWNCTRQKYYDDLKWKWWEKILAHVDKNKCDHDKNYEDEKINRKVIMTIIVPWKKGKDKRWINDDQDEIICFCFIMYIILLHFFFTLFLLARFLVHSLINLLSCLVHFVTMFIFIVFFSFLLFLLLGIILVLCWG